MKLTEDQQIRLAILITNGQPLSLAFRVMAILGADPGLALLEKGPVRDEAGMYAITDRYREAVGAINAEIERRKPTDRKPWESA